MEVRAIIAIQILPRLTHQSYNTELSFYRQEWECLTDSERQVHVLMIRISGKPLQSSVAGRGGWGGSFFIIFFCYCCCCGCQCWGAVRCGVARCRATCQHRGFIPSVPGAVSEEERPTPSRSRGAAGWSYGGTAAKAQEIWADVLYN